MNRIVEKLAARNRYAVTKLLGRGFVQKSLSDGLSCKEILLANEKLSASLYGRKVYAALRMGDVQCLEKMSRDNMERVILPIDVLDNVNLDDYALVLVRPEMIGRIGEIRDYLIHNGFYICIEKHAEVNFFQYWAMYHAGLIHPDAQMDFPTRTLNYINRPIYIIIAQLKNGESSASDLLHNLKGVQGCYQKNTLRGDLVYNFFNEYVTANQEIKSKAATMAFDPIGTIRALVQGRVASDQAHNTVDNPLLFYIGQGIHVPKGNEISRDLRILLTDKEIEMLSTKRNLRILITEGMESSVYVDRIGGKDVYVKRAKKGRRQDYKFEAGVLQELEKVHAKAPRFIGLSGGGDELTISKVPGFSIDDTSLIFSAGIYNDVACEMEKWRAILPKSESELKKVGVVREYDARRVSLALGLERGKRVMDMVRILEEKHRNYLDSVRKTLVHGDFSFDSIFADNGVFSGVIDFGDAFFGDPLLDVAYFRFKEINKPYGARSYKLLVNALKTNPDDGLVALYMIYFALDRILDCADDGIRAKFIDKLDRVLGMDGG